MEHSIKILEKVQWIFKPISKIILFLFTTKTGILLLLLSIIAYFIYRIYLRLYERKLLNQAATGDKGIKFTDLINAIVEETVSLTTKLFSNISVLLIVFIVLSAIVGLSSTFSAVSDFLNNQRRIKELKITLKNLDKRYKVMQVKILNYDYKTNTTKLKIKFFDYAKNDFIPKDQIITLKGHDIYFLTYVMNFDYSEIETGKQINLAFPVMIFTEKIAQDSGIALNIRDTIGIPYIFHRKQKDLYGIDSTHFSKRMLEIIQYINDPDKARLAGVRSFHAVAPHSIRLPRKGQSYIIWVEQTGGLVIKKEEQW